MQEHEAKLLQKTQLEPKDVATQNKLKLHVARTRREAADAYMYVPAFMTIFGLVMTLTFDLLTSKSSQFIFIPKCIQIVNSPRSL